MYFVIRQVTVTITDSTGIHTKSRWYLKVCSHTKL